MATRLRFVLDYLRYLEPRYRGADKLRARVEAFVPRPLLIALGLPVLRSRAVRGAGPPVRLVERRIKPPATVAEYLRHTIPMWCWSHR